MDILLGSAVRFTPAWKAFPMAWQRWDFESSPVWEGYRFLILCRGARIPAKQVSCKPKARHDAFGWTRAKGALFLIKEGEYEIRIENVHLENYSRGLDATPKPMVVPGTMGPYFYGSSAYSPHTHTWTPGDTDDS